MAFDNEHGLNDLESCLQLNQKCFICHISFTTPHYESLYRQGVIIHLFIQRPVQWPLKMNKAFIALKVIDCMKGFFELGASRMNFINIRSNVLCYYIIGK